MSKKLILYILVISILISLFTINAAADSVVNGKPIPDVTDLLTDDFYHFAGTDGWGNIYVDHEISSPFMNVRTNTAEIWWELASDNHNVDHISITIESVYTPTQVWFKRWNGNNAYLEATHKASVGHLHTYVLDIDSSQLPLCGIKAEWNWNNPYVGIFGIRAVRGYSNIYHDVSNASYRFEYDYRITGDAIRNDTSSYGSSVSLPISAAQTFLDDQDGRLIGGKFRLFLSDLQRSYRDIDNLLAYFWCYDEDPRVTINVNDYNGAVLYAIDCSLVQSVSRITSGSVENTIFVYELTADFSHVDVGNYQIEIVIESDPFKYAIPNDYQVYTFFESVYVKPVLEDLPWYKIFFNWCADLWRSCCDAVIEAFNSIFGEVDFNQSFNNMTDGTPDMQGQAGSFSDAASDANQSFKDKMDEVQDAQSQFQPVSTDWDGFKSQFDGLVVNGSPIMTMIVDQHMPTLILEIVFIVSLIAYILFGKRG